MALGALWALKCKKGSGSEKRRRQFLIGAVQVLHTYVVFP